MRKIIRSAGAVFLAIVLTSCGGNTKTNENQSTDPQENTVKESAPGLTITLSETESCDGGSIMLKITGGKPFQGEKPYIVEAQYVSGNDGQIYPNEFKKEENGYTLEIGTSVRGDESKQQLIVTDADGNKEILDFLIYNCP